MSKPLLSAAMIVCDEARHLGACLESIRDVVDEVVVIDTGSSDATVEIARSHGARVRVHPWQEDFATPRNVGLDLARGAWILYIDADERLQPLDIEWLRRRLEAAPEIALRVRLRPMAQTTPYWEYRLWRSDPRIRFVGKMHEKITPAIAAVSAADRRVVGESPLYLNHVGYDGDQSHKHRRNVTLLRAQLDQDPGDAYSWHHLARVLDALGDPGPSEAALKRAVEIAESTGTPTGPLALAEAVRRRREQGEDTTRLVDDAVGLYPDNIALAWEKVQAEIRAGRYESALTWLTRFDVDPEMPIEDTISYPLSLFGVAAPEARGLCLFKLGRFREAADAYSEAEAFAPTELAHRVKRVLSEHLAGRHRAESPDGSEPVVGQGGRWSARELVTTGRTIEVGGVIVELTATDAMRAHAIWSTLGLTLSSARPADVHLSFGSHPAPLPQRKADEFDGPLQLWHDEVLSLAGEGTVTGHVAGGRGRVGGYAPDLVRAFRTAAPFMLASLLAGHERFVLHAAAVARDGGAVLALGGTGAGKSTLVMGALRSGWSVLADDLVVARLGPSGPEVQGIPKPLAVPLDTLERSGDRPRGGDPRERVAYPFEAWERGWHPVAAVVLAGHGDGERAALRPIGSRALLGLLLRTMFCRQRAGVRGYFALAVRLSELPAGRLLHARPSIDRPERAVETLAALVATPSTE